jgi:peptidoglycan hydrolase-like protein with peptidoglycan-binding domain
MWNISAVSIAVMVVIASGCALENPDDDTPEDAETRQEQVPSLDAEMSDTEIMKLTAAQCTSVIRLPTSNGNVDLPVSSNGNWRCWMDIGSSGPAVRALQRALMECWEFAIGPRIVVDGQFGPRTATAVRGLQTF